MTAAVTSGRVPIACSLLPGQLAQRLDEVAALGAHALIDARRVGTHAELRFAAGSGVRDRVQAIAAAEAACCPFLAMNITDEPDVVLLVIDAPADGEPVLGELVGAFGNP